MIVIIVVSCHQISSVISNIIIYFETGCRVNTNPGERRRMQTSFESLTEVQKVLVSWFILVNLVHFCPFSAILVHFSPFWSISFLFSMCGRLRGILITDTSCGGVLNKRRRLDGLKILTLPMIPVSIFHKYFCGAPASCAQYTIVRISQ